MRVVTKAYENYLESKGIVLPQKTQIQRIFLEPFARLAGLFLAAILERLPASWAISFHDKLFSRLASGRAYLFNPDSAAIIDARVLSARLEKESGRTPALLAAISHPEGTEELAHLNFELVRHAILALREIRGRPCRPRLVVAIDPFALDTVSILEEGLYAGFMGSFHLGLDRLAFGRGHPGPWLSPQTHWDRMPLRLFSSLAQGGEIGMVLSGGVPSTSRVLYGAREWARRALSASPLHAYPLRALACLRNDAAFARFENSAAGIVPLSRGPWRLVEAWLMMAAVGLLRDESVEPVARALLACVQVPEAARDAIVSELACDLARETPARRRLFQILVGRVVRRRPLLLIPVVHRLDPLGVSEREAWGIVWAGTGRVRVIRAGSPDRSVEMTATELAERFTIEHFQ